MSEFSIIFVKVLAAQANVGSAFTGLVGPSGNIGPSGLCGPSGCVAFQTLRTIRLRGFLDSTDHFLESGLWALQCD